MTQTNPVGGTSARRKQRAESHGTHRVRSTEEFARQFRLSTDMPRPDTFEHMHAGHTIESEGSVMRGRPRDGAGGPGGLAHKGANRGGRNARSGSCLSRPAGETHQAPQRRSKPGPAHRDQERHRGWTGREATRMASRIAPIRGKSARARKREQTTRLGHE